MVTLRLGNLNGRLWPVAAYRADSATDRSRFIPVGGKELLAVIRQMHTCKSPRYPANFLIVPRPSERRFNSPHDHQYSNPNCSQLGFFLARSRRFPRVCAGSCGNLRTSPVGRMAHSWAPFALSWPFFSPASLREWPEVRRGPVWCHLKSMGYARTVQAVGLHHCLPGGEQLRPGCRPSRPYRPGSAAAAC